MSGSRAESLFQPLRRRDAGKATTQDDDAPSCIARALGAASEENHSNYLAEIMNRPWRA
jgi:hypothetical protein